MPTEAEIKRKIGVIQSMLDILRKVLGLQTQLERQTLIELARKIAQEEGVGDIPIFLATIQCESGFNPNAKNVNPNGTTDWGICQYNDYWYKEAVNSGDAMIPEKALRIMAKQFVKGGANDWVCFKTGKYIPYLNEFKA